MFWKGVQKCALVSIYCDAWGPLVEVRPASTAHWFMALRPSNQRSLDTCTWPYTHDNSSCLTSIGLQDYHCFNTGTSMNSWGNSVVFVLFWRVYCRVSSTECNGVGGPERCRGRAPWPRVPPSSTTETQLSVCLDVNERGVCNTGSMRLPLCVVATIILRCPIPWHMLVAIRGINVNILYVKFYDLY